MSPKPNAESVKVMKVAGDIDATMALSLHHRLMRLRTEGYQCFVVVDCSKVPHISCGGVGTLLQHAVELRKQGGDLCVANPSRLVQMILSVLNLDEHLNIFPTVEAAVDAMCAIDTCAPAGARHGSGKGDSAMVDLSLTVDVGLSGSEGSKQTDANRRQPVPIQSTGGSARPLTLFESHRQSAGAGVGRVRAAAVAATRKQPVNRARAWELPISFPTPRPCVI